MPFVSIIIPAFNARSTIGLTLGSVLSQYYRDFEVIVVDDASTEAFNDVIDKFGDRRIKYLRNTSNRGPTHAKNRGIRESAGEILCFLDADDFWRPEYLEQVVRKFNKEPDLDVVYTRFYNGPPWTLQGKNIYPSVLSQGFLCAPSVLSVRKAVFERVSWDETYRASEDDKFCFELSRFFNIGIIPEGLAYYGRGHGSMGSDKQKAALGFQRLYREYKSDILTYCGPRTYSKHLMSTSIRMLESGLTQKGLLLFLASLFYFYEKRKDTEDISSLLIARTAVRLFESSLIRISRRMKSLTIEKTW